MNIIKRLNELRLLFWAAICLILYLFLNIFNISQILNSITISLFAAFVASWIIEKGAKEKFEKLVCNQLPNFSQITKTGLSKVVYANKLLDIYPDINNTKKLYIMMNDGKNFYSNNAEWLTKRLKESNKETYLILLKEDSISQEILCNRHNKDSKEHYSNKIKETIAYFNENISKRSKLEIYKYDYFFTTSIVLTDTFAIIGTYRNSAGKELPPPQFIFEDNGKNSEYHRILEDIKKVKSKSQLIS